MSEYLSNSANIVGIGLSEEKRTAEVVTINLCDGGMLYHDLHYFRNAEIKKVAYCTLGLKQENLVDIYKEKIVFRIKKGFMILDAFLMYFQEYSIYYSEYFIQEDPSGSFETLTFLFKNEQIRERKKDLT